MSDTAPSPLLLTILRKAEALGWTRAQIAEAAGVGESTISLWYSGQRNPSFEVFERLSNAVNGAALTEKESPGGHLDLCRNEFVPLNARVSLVLTNGQLHVDYDWRDTDGPSGWLPDYLPHTAFHTDYPILNSAEGTVQLAKHNVLLVVEPAVVNGDVADQLKLVEAGQQMLKALRAGYLEATVENDLIGRQYRIPLDESLVVLGGQVSQWKAALIGTLPPKENRKAAPIQHLVGGKSASAPRSDAIRMDAIDRPLTLKVVPADLPQLHVPGTIVLRAYLTLLPMYSTPWGKISTANVKPSQLGTPAPHSTTNRHTTPVLTTEGTLLNRPEAVDRPLDDSTRCTVYMQAPLSQRKLTFRDWDTPLKKNLGVGKAQGMVVGVQARPAVASDMHQRVLSLETLRDLVHRWSRLLASHIVFFLDSMIVRTVIPIAMVVPEDYEAASLHMQQDGCFSAKVRIPFSEGDHDIEVRVPGGTPLDREEATDLLHLDIMLSGWERYGQMTYEKARQLVESAEFAKGFRLRPWTPTDNFTPSEKPALLLERIEESVDADR